MSLEDLISAAEPNPLLRQVDSYCANRDWIGLVDLASRCREATERGKQLWPIAEHIEYRLALEAPAEFAGPIIGPEAGRFALGPLSEVAASTHTFQELAPYLTSDQVRGTVAAERVIRGEDLSANPDACMEVLELPPKLTDWEPTYPVATYRSDKAEFPAPEVSKEAVRESLEELPIGLETPDEVGLTRALWDLTETWVSGSNGAATAEFAGSVEEAIRSLPGPKINKRKILPRDSFALMAWAGASGGSHGRRRGAAFGRFAAWWLGVVATGLEWPADGQELGARIEQIEWFTWQPEVESGWHLQLALGDSAGNWGAAISAVDRF